MTPRRGTPWLLSEIGFAPGPPRYLAPEGAKTRAVVLGSGGVTPNPHRHGPGAAVIVNDTTYLIDAGEGIWRGLAWAAASHPEMIAEHLAPYRLTSLFLTHLHSDHTIGLPAVWLMPWAYGREVPLEVYGPVGTRSLMEHLEEAYQADLQERRFGPGADKRKIDAHKTVAHEIKDSGTVYEDGTVKIEAFHHKHGNFEQTSPIALHPRIE